MVKPVRCRLCGKVLKVKQVYYHFKTAHPQHFIRLLAKWVKTFRTGASFVKVCLESGLCEEVTEEAK